MKLLPLLLGKTPQQKVRICYRVLELLRLRHNVWGEKFRNGEITEDEWNTFLSTWTQRQKQVFQVVNAIKEKQNLFNIENESTSLTLKSEGKILTEYDTDIDIDNID